MIQLEQLSVARGKFRIDKISLRLGKGGYLCLLGPSGAGKTVLLESILGLLPPEQGGIYIGGQEVSGLPSEKRNISYLPQDLALFPHLSVRDNILFGARVRKLEKEETAQRLQNLAQLLDIEELLERKHIKTLSGGEKQRVALARALLTRPQLLLLDEPFSALDACIKRQLQLKLQQINRELGVTVIHVTHDREEAYMLGEQIAVLIDGRLQQIGSHDDIYYRPASVEVARFLLNQNIFRMQVKECLDNGDLLLNGSLRLQTPNPGNLSVGTRVYAGIRGEEIIILRPDREVPDWLQTNRFLVRVEQICHKGGLHAIFARATEFSTELELEIPNCAFRDLRIEIGDELNICLKRNAIWVIADPEPAMETA